MSRLNLQQARELAQSKLSPGTVILDESTMEREWGWVFFFNSMEFLETGDVMQSLCGNAPLFVNRIDGAVISSGTCMPIENYLAEYELQLGFGMPTPSPHRKNRPSLLRRLKARLFGW